MNTMYSAILRKLCILPLCCRVKLRLRMEDVEDVLNFWFCPTDSAQSSRAREEWFKMNPTFDEQIRARFGSLHAQAAAHRLDDWNTSIRGRLALILLLDQFSRNLYRDSPRAFACDAQALALAQAAIDAGLDRDLLPLQRMFLYMPFSTASTSSSSGAPWSSSKPCARTRRRRNATSTPCSTSQ